MGKFVVLSFLLIGVYMWCFLTGIYEIDSTQYTTESGNATLIHTLTHPESMQNSFFFGSILSVMTGLGFGIIVGLVYKDLDKSVATGVFVTLVGFMWQTVSAFTQVLSTSSVMLFFMYALFAPFAIIYLFTFLEWWRLKD